MAIYALISFAPGTSKSQLRTDLQSRVADKLSSLDQSERPNAISVLREAIGEVSSSWINSNPRYQRSTGKLILEFDEVNIQNKKAVKKFFQLWEADPGVDIYFTRDTDISSSFIVDSEVL